ncbi:MAG: hypothetical protein IT318_13020 [Anaerolineales bacterium]|nr:hypothetical protein [Anaerolineales bacterium]
MVKSYSQDLRERVIYNWQAGQTQAWIAQHLAISVSTIKRYISQHRRQGDVQAKQPRYNQPTIRDEQLGALVAQLTAHADATIAQHRQWWGEQQGQWVSQSMMWRAIDRASWTRQKRQWGSKNGMR